MTRVTQQDFSAVCNRYGFIIRPRTLQRDSWHVDEAWYNNQLVGKMYCKRQNNKIIRTYYLNNDLL